MTTPKSPASPAHPANKAAPLGLRTEAFPGVQAEVSQALLPVTPGMDATFTRFWEASRDWDGSDPARPFM